SPAAPACRRPALLEMPCRTTAANRSPPRDSAVARNAASLGYLVQLDLVAERVENVRAPPARDGVGFLKARAGCTELRRGRIEIVDAKREVSSRMEAELAVGRQMHVTRWRRIPDPRSVAEGDGALQLVEPEGRSVELPSSGSLARRIEHLRVMQGNAHKFESRRAQIQCFSRVSWAIICSTRRRCCLGDRANPDDD